MPDKVRCYGCGAVRCEACSGYGIDWGDEPCVPCNGRGWFPAEECPDYWDACPMNRYEGQCEKRCAAGDLHGSDHMILCPECREKDRK